MAMTKRKPEFYFISAETAPAIGPRACYVQRKLSPTPADEYLAGYEYLLVKIEPPLHWETWLGTIDTDELVLAERGRGPAGFRPIYPRTEWPGWVNAVEILNKDIKRTGKTSADDLRHILIGELWPSEEEAEKNLRIHHGRSARQPWI